MFPVERRKAILDYLDKKYSAKVDELAAVLFTGEATVRRDLDRMAKEGLLTRTHGGAVKLGGENTEYPYDFRASANAQIKDRLAAAAAEMVRDGDSLFLDGSTTVIHMIPHLGSRRGLKIIANGVNTAYELSARGFDGASTGGAFSMASGSLTGADAIRTVERYNCDFFFFSCKALSAERGITESSPEVAAVKEAMARHARASVLLCDSGKFDRASLCVLDVLDSLSCVISDERPGAELSSFLSRRGIKFLLA